MMTPIARTARFVLTSLLAVFPAVFLGACGSGSSGKPTAQKSITGCRIPGKWMPQRMIEEMIVEGFRDEHAVTEPEVLAQMNALFANGLAATSLDFDKWYGQNEERPDVAVGGITMGTWETLLKNSVFGEPSNVYPAICAGWTFEGYLDKHPGSRDKPSSASSSSSGTSTPN